MKKHYLKIGPGIYRVDVNLNTVEAWENMSGIDLARFEVMAATSDKTKGLSTGLMVQWLYCSLVEGEALEGRVFPYSYNELRRTVKPSILSHFTPIFLACYMNDAIPSPKEVEKEFGTKRGNGRMIKRFVRSPWVIAGGVVLIISILIALNLIFKFY